MTPLEYATKVGLLVRRKFLSPQLCESVCAHIHAAPREAGTILLGDRPVIDEHTRKAKHAVVPTSVRQPVADRLYALMPQISEHLGVSVSGLRDLQFLRYDKGDFFAFHRDRDDRVADEPQRVRERQVSAVVFLNQESASTAAGTYGGGELQFYMPDLIPGYRRAKFSFPAAPGTLVAFNPQVLHQVLPVTHGQRYTIVTWFV
jgi:SM-20-related protein